MQEQFIIDLSQGYPNDHANLAALAMGKEVIVIVPGEDVLLVHAKLPKMNRSRFLKVLPFALEEQLIDEVETLHFALAETQDTGDLAVAVVRQQKMQEW